MTGDLDTDSPQPEPPPTDLPASNAKVSRWDRPPEPHDWRWVVGNIGRAMITVGLLMFGFVAYQLWGTGIQTARAQNHLDNQLDQYIVDKGITPDTIGPTTTTTPPASDGTTTTSVPSTTPPSAAPVDQNYGTVAPGDGIARLTIPKIGVDYVLVAGVSVKDLRSGPGHFPNTPLPGQLGNSAIAGHRTTYGAPFFHLDRLKAGDEIQFQTKLGGAYVYIVTDSVVVNPSDYYVITDSDPTQATVTLVTCTPVHSAQQRLVVHATLDPSRSSPVGKPIINYGQAQPIPVETVLPSDTEEGASTPDTSTVATTPGSSATTNSTDSTGSTGSTPSTPAGGVGAPSTTVPTTTNADFAANDAFSQGWFDDGSAWPQVIAWGVLLGLVWYGGYRLAKHYRKLWLGFVVGLIPFLVVLYFFYENVNRLLPATI